MIGRMKVTCTIIPSNWLSALTVKSVSFLDVDFSSLHLFLVLAQFTFSSQFLRWIEFQKSGRKKKKIGI